MATQLFTFRYRFNWGEGRKSLWSTKNRAWRTLKGAEAAAKRERAVYAGMSSDVETDVVELVSDGRHGRVSAEGAQ